MGVFDLIRAVFGLGGSDDSDGTKVSVEYDSEDDPADTAGKRDEDDGTVDEMGDATADDSVGGDASVGAETETATAAETDATAAAGTDAAASTGSMTETPSPEPESAAEPAEAGAGMTEQDEPSGAEPAEDVAPASEKLDSDVEPSEEVEAGDAEPSSAAESDGVERDADPVDTVSGIGPAYAQRLAEAEIETVEELLEADAGELAEQTDISEKRIQRWQESASEA